MATNPKFISTLSNAIDGQASNNDTEHIQDGTDKLHSGVINALNIGTGLSFVIHGGDITQNNGGSTYTRFNITEIKYLRDGKLLTASAVTNQEPAWAVNSANDWYGTVVIADGSQSGESANTIKFRGATALGTTTSKTASPKPGDIPIAIIQIAKGSAAKAVDRKVQFLGIGKASQSMSFFGSNFTEDLRINDDGTITKGGATITFPATTGNVVTTGDSATITATMLAANSVDSSELVDGSIDTSHIADDQVTYAKIQNVSATNRILGRDSSGAGIIEEITPASLRTMINVEDGADVTDETNVKAILAALDSTDTLYIGDSGNDTTVDIRGNLTVQGTQTVVNTVTMNAANAIVFEGATADAHETTLTIDDPDQDNTITLPDATGTVVLHSLAQTLTNKTIDADNNTITDLANANIKAGAAISATKIANGTISNTEFQYLNGVTSAIQTQIDGKSPTAGNTSLVTVGTISTGTWNATAIADGKIASASTWNAKLSPTIGDYTDLGTGTDSTNDKLIVYDNSASTFKKAEVTDILNEIASGNVVGSGKLWANTLPADGAEVNVQADWNASSGDAKILNKPNVQYTSAIPNATASQTGLATATQITKLNAIEASADVTDTTNVTAAGALMDSEVTNLAFVKGLASGISDGNVLVANANVADNDFLRVDGTSIEGRTAAQVRSDLGIADDEIIDWTADQGSTNIHSGNYTDTNTWRSIEAIQDIVGAMFTSNTETRISATYEDGDATIDLVVDDLNTDTQLSTEAVQDIVGAMFSGNTETNITATYQDSDGTIDLVGATTGLSNIVEDTSPQLGGNLDLVTHHITTTSNRNIDLKPHGTGTVRIFDADVGFPSAPSAGKLSVIHDGDDGPTLLLSDGDNGSGSGPNMLFYRDTSSPADDDILGKVSFQSTTSNGTYKTYTEIKNTIEDVTDGTTDAIMSLRTQKNGTLTDMLTISGENNLVKVHGNFEVTGTQTIVDTVTMNAANAIVFEGATADAYETTLTITDPTADRTITLPDTSGTVALTSQLAGAGSDTTYSAGTGLDLSSTTFSVDMSELISNAGNNKVLTAKSSSSTTVQAEGSLLFDGTNLGIGTTPEYAVDVAGSLRILPTISSHAGTAIRIGPQDNDIDVTLLRIDGNGGGAGSGNSGESNDSNYGFSMKYMGSGTGTANRYALFMDNSTGTALEGMTVLQDGKTGIGTSTPATKLDVAGSITVADHIIHSGDTNNMISFGTDTQTFKTAGTSRMKIMSGGAIGIGTDTPVSRLHIEKGAYDYDDGTQDEDGDFHLMLKASEGSNSGDAVSLGFAQSTDGTTVGAKISHVVSGSYSRGHLTFSTNNTDGAADTTVERMRITNDGNVGIGTITPGSMLEVDDTNAIVEVNASTNGSGVGWFKVSDQGTSKWAMGLSKNASLSGSDFHIFEDASSNSPRFTIKDGGNVGIGTTSPDVPLHIKSTATGALLRLESTEAGSGSSPTIDLYRNSGSPAVSDFIGNILFSGTNDNSGEKVNYAGMEVFIEDETDATENAAIKFNVYEMGTPRTNFTIGSTLCTFNQNSRNMDVRMLSDDGTNNFFSDASTNRIGIGTNAPTGTLSIQSSGHDMIHLNRTVDNEGYGMGIIGRAGNDSSTTAAHEYAGMFFQIEDHTDGAEKGSIAFNTSTGGTAADSSSTHAMQITSDNKVGIGTSTPQWDLSVPGDVAIGWYNNFTGTNTATGATDATLRVAGRAFDKPAIIELANFDANNFYGGTTTFKLGELAFAMNENSNTVTRVAKIEAWTETPSEEGHFDGRLLFSTSAGDASGANLTTKMVIDGDGKVGIGTDAPSTALDVAGDISGDRLNLEKSSGYASIELGGGSGAFIDMKNPFSDDFDCRIITDGTGLDIIAAGSGNHITLKTNGTERFQVEDSAITFFNAYAFPNADGSANQVLKTDGSGSLSWANQSGSGSSFAVGDITGATALTSGLASTDELVLSDNGTLKRMDISVVEAYMSDNLAELYIRDRRNDGDVAPSAYMANAMSLSFTDEITGSDNSWDGVLTMKGWGDDYRAWQLVSSNVNGSDSMETEPLYFRSGEDSSWGSLRKVVVEDGSTKDVSIGGNLSLAENKRIYFDSTDTYIYANTDATESLHVAADASIYLDPDSDVVIRAGSTEWARFDGSTQRVGIGTTSPECELHVEGSIAVAYALAHAGQTGQNRLVFGTNTQTFQTAGTTRMTIQADGDIDVSGGIQSTSSTKGWNNWSMMRFGKLDYGTSASGGAGLKALTFDDNEAGYGNIAIPTDITIRAVQFRTSGVVLSGTTAQVWRIFANGDAGTGTLTNLSLDASDFTRQNSENANSTAHTYTMTGLSASYDAGDIISIRRESGAVDMGDVIVDIYYSHDI